MENLFDLFDFESRRVILFFLAFSLYPFQFHEHNQRERVKHVEYLRQDFHFSTV